MNPTKICTKCQEEKQATNDYFNKHPQGLFGLSSKCKSCEKKYKEEYRKNNKDVIKKHSKKYYSENKEKIIKSQKEYYNKNIDKKKKYNKEYNELNKENLKQKSLEYYNDNRDNILNYHKEYYAKNKKNISKYQKEYNNKNKKIISEKSKQYRDKNKEELSNKSKTYYINNKEKIINKRKEYYKTPEGKLTAITSAARRRSLKNKQNQGFGQPNKKLIREIYKNCPKEYEVDHMRPLTKGGDHHESNLCYLPISINRSKKNKLIEEFGEQTYFEHAIYWQDLLTP